MLRSRSLECAPAARDFSTTHMCHRIRGQLQVLPRTSVVKVLQFHPTRTAAAHTTRSRIRNLGGNSTKVMSTTTPASTAADSRFNNSPRRNETRAFSCRGRKEPRSLVDPWSLRASVRWRFLAAAERNTRFARSFRGIRDRSPRSSSTASTAMRHQRQGREQATLLNFSHRGGRTLHFHALLRS
jgi:hypothetical protein